MLRFLILSLVCLFSLSYLKASDTLSIQQLKVIEIQERAPSTGLENTATKISELATPIFSSDLLKPMSAWLEHQSNAYLRSNGVNSASMLSLRGASPAQTGIFWNEMPIRNLSSGISDLNAFPNFFFEEAWILYDGQGSRLGSGSMGGALVLQQTDFKASQKPVLKSSSLFNYSSLNNYDFGQQVSMHNARTTHQIKWIGSRHRNDFNFMDQDQIFSMKHSRADRNSFMTNHQILLPKDQWLLSVHSWLHQSKLEIPATRYESDSEKHLNTDFFKIQASLATQQKPYEFKAAFQFSSDQYEYQDWTINRSSPYNFQQFMVLLKLDQFHSFHFWNRSWTIESNTRFPLEYAQIQLFNGKKSDFFNSWSGLFSQHFRIQPWHRNFLIDLGFGVELDSREQSQWLPSITFQHHLHNFEFRGSQIAIHLGGTGQKGYRKPTLVDLYLFPGGNKNLTPEIAWGASLNGAIDIKKEYNQHHDWSIQSSVGWYHRKVKDWIYWLGATIWTPYNIASVHNRGVETEHEIQWRFQDFKLDITGTTAYNLATTLNTPIMEEEDLGKQLPYTPRYQFNYQFNLAFKGWSILYQGNYIGYRFTTLDESSYLTPYFLEHISLAKRFNFKGIDWSPQIKINNLRNKTYEVISYRPMPGRYLEMSIKMDLST